MPRARTPRPTHQYVGPDITGAGKVGMRHGTLGWVDSPTATVDSVDGPLVTFRPAWWAELEVYVPRVEVRALEG